LIQFKDVLTPHQQGEHTASAMISVSGAHTVKVESLPRTGEWGFVAEAGKQAHYPKPKVTELLLHIT
jgi:hypothetical protein